MTSFLTVLALVLPLCFGVTLLVGARVYPGAHPALLAGAAFGIGMMLISFVLAFLLVLGLPLSLDVALPALLIVWAAGLVLIRRYRGMPLASERRDCRTPRLGWPLRVVWWFGTAVLVGKVALIIGRAMETPVIGWDAMTVHSLRAKAMFYDHTLSVATLRWIGNADYPLGVPLAELWVTLFQGQWDDIALKILFPGFLAALLAMFYGGLREVCGSLGALLGTWIAASLPLMVQHAVDAYLDLPLAYASLGTSLFLWRFTRTRLLRDLIVASWMAAWGIWIKNEGWLAFEIECALLALFFAQEGLLRERSGWIRLVQFGAVPFFVWSVWTLAKLTSGISPSVAVQVQAFSLFEHIDRLPTVVAFIARELWLSANWNILWPLFFGGWLLHFRRSFAPAFLFFGWPVVLTLVAFVLVSTATIMYDFLLLGSTLHRVVLHIAPLAAFWVALVIGRRVAGVRQAQLVPVTAGAQAG